MKALGLAIARDRLSAVCWERTVLGSRPVAACAVPCSDPFGGAADAERLAQELRARGVSRNVSAILSLPPAWTYLRPLTLPVSDLPRARAVHLAEIEGTLPFDDDEIVSDLFPAPPGRPGAFLAAAARRPVIEKVLGTMAQAGFRIEQVVPEVAALVAAATWADRRFDGLAVSFAGDVVALRLEAGAVAWARQFPAALLEDAATFLEEWDAMASSGGADATPARIVAFGDPPPALSGRQGALSPAPLPSGLDPSLAAAFGAALVPWRRRETGGFAFRTASLAESAAAKERLAARFAAISALLAAAALCAAVLAAAWAEERRAQAIQAQLRRELAEIFPGISPGAQPLLQFQERMRALARLQKETGADAEPLYDQLGRVAAALPARERIVVSEIGYDAGRIRVAGEADGAAPAEAFRAALAASFGPPYAATMESSRGGPRGAVRFTILLERRESGRAS